MPSSDVYSLVKARLDANPIAGFPFTYPDGSPDAPTDKSPFVDVSFPVVTSEQITFGSPGSNTFRETGTVQFVIAAKRVTGGFAVGLTTSETIRALFRNWRSGSLKFWEPSPPATNNENQDGAYFKLTTSAPYWFDFLA